MSLICGSVTLSSLSHERPTQGAQEYFREVGGDCSVTSVGKFRNGSPKAWCQTHARVVRPAVDNTCPDRGSVLKLRCLSLDIDRYPGGIGIWGSLPPAIDTASANMDEESLLRGIHVHARPDLKFRKEVDNTYDVVALYRGSELVVTLDTASSTALVQARIAGTESSLIKCPRCGAEHLDEGWFAVTPHRKHQCMCCGREFYDKIASSGNTVETRINKLFPNSRQPRVHPGREIDLTRHLDAGRNIRIWGTHEAIVWTAERFEEAGVHVHIHDRYGDHVVDETFDRVILHGTELDAGQVRLLMLQKSLDHLTGRIRALRCQHCAADLCSSNTAAVNPSCSHKCQKCGKITTTHKKLVINPLASWGATTFPVGGHS